MSSPPRYRWRDEISETTLPPHVKLVAYDLARHMNDAGECHPGMGDLTRHTSLAKAAVQRHLRRLREAGKLVVAQPPAPARATVYRAVLAERLIPEVSDSDDPREKEGRVSAATPVHVSVEIPVDGNTSHSGAQRVSVESQHVSLQAPTGLTMRRSNPLKPLVIKPPDEPAAEPQLMSMEEIKADPTIQQPLDELENLSDEWRKSRPYVEKLALRMPCIAEALQAALKTERQKPGSIIGATRFTRKVAYKIYGDQQHQDWRAKERARSGDGPAAALVTQAFDAEVLEEEGVS